MDKKNIKSLKSFLEIFDESDSFNYNDPTFKLLQELQPANHRLVICKSRQCGKSHVMEMLNHMNKDPFLNNPIYVKKLFLRNGTYNFIINKDRPNYVLVKLKGEWASTNINHILDKIKKKCVLKKDIEEIEKVIMNRL
jgi:hypothetical protein